MSGPRKLLAFAVATWSFTDALLASSFERTVQPFLEAYCVSCHGEEKVKGKVDFRMFNDLNSVQADYEVWERVLDVLDYGDMPPEDAARRPTRAESQAVIDWLNLEVFQSAASLPGPGRPRRLSAREYRNTLRDLLGFDLEVAIREAEQTVVERSLVMKLLPTDPPGASGFQNDTHAAPLSGLLWEQYAYLADLALDRFFAQEQVNLWDYGRRVAWLRDFLSRARRRPIAQDALMAVLDRVDFADDPDVALREELRGALMAPAFLYRGLLHGVPPADEVTPVDEFELAERLSYFLWGSLPDKKLTDHARAGTLRDQLASETDRLIDTTKFYDFVRDFADQWLALSQMDVIGRRQVPLAEALKSQPIEFLHYLFSENRPLLELIDSRMTYANPLIARYYPNDRSQIATYRKPKGIELEIVPLTPIVLRETPERGGLLTMPGILTMNRGPILRGVWMLERILGVHLPEPPPNIPAVEPSPPGEDLTFRERFAKHRDQPSCAVCHNEIDPLGFALGAYDDSGNFRPGPEVDASGQLPNGETFETFEELKELLLTTQREPIIRNIVERVLAYALCRRLELTDRAVVDSITAEALDDPQFGWRDLIHRVVQSLPFQHIYRTAPDHELEN